MDPSDYLSKTFWLLVLACVLATAALFGSVANAQTPVTVVDCAREHDTCRYSTTDPSENAVEACLQLNAPGWTLDDCGGVYPSCWSYGIGNHDYCATLPNSPASESDPCYAGCLGAEATACGRTIEVDCITCRPAYGPSTPRCQECGTAVEVCFLENIPTDPADPNYPGEGGYNPDDPQDPSCYGSADCDEDDEPPFTNCDSSVQSCACDVDENGNFVDESNVGNCSGDFNGDGDVDEDEIVNKVCDDSGMCSCPAGTVEVAIGSGNGCQVQNECAYYGGYKGNAANCGCGRLYLYEGECVNGCPAGSTLSGGQCVPDNQDTGQDPYIDVIQIGGDVCAVTWAAPENADEQAERESTLLQDIQDSVIGPSCRLFVTAVQRVFSPTFVAGDECPFSFEGASVEIGGEDYDLYANQSQGGIVCTTLEEWRGPLSNVLGWVYLIMAVVAFIRWT